MDFKLIDNVGRYHCNVNYSRRRESYIILIYYFAVQWMHRWDIVFNECQNINENRILVIDFHPIQLNFVEGIIRVFSNIT